MESSPMGQRAAAALLALSCSFAGLNSPSLWASAAPTGVFESHADVGSVLHPGSLEYDPIQGKYTVSGGGENVWAMADAFHFVWKKVAGDVSLAADVAFLSKGGNEHRKAVLMVRQSLDADSPYADVALHGNGMPALQYRDEKSALTHEVQASSWGPKRLRIQKRGAFFTMWLDYGDGEFHLAGGSARM